MGAWNKICKPQSYGGLGLRSLLRLNEVANLKLGWNLTNSEEPWATILKAIIKALCCYPTSHFLYSLAA